MCDFDRSPLLCVLPVLPNFYVCTSVIHVKVSMCFYLYYGNRYCSFLLRLCKFSDLLYKFFYMRRKKRIKIKDGFNFAVVKPFCDI